MQTDSLKCVALASKNRSLADFEKVRVAMFMLGFYSRCLFLPAAELTVCPSRVPDLQALTDYKSELRDDPIISTHLTKLYDKLLEQNLIRVIEPFSRVQVTTLRFHIGNFALTIRIQ